MNTYFVFWEKRTSDGKPPNLEARSLQAGEVSARNGELNFWLEEGSTQRDNLVFSVPLATLVDFHTVKPLEVTEPKTVELPKLDREFMGWLNEDKAKPTPTSIAVLVEEMENATTWYKASRDKPHMNKGFFTDYNKTKRYEQFISHIRAIGKYSNEMFFNNETREFGLSQLLLEGICRSAYIDLKTWLEDEKYEEKHPPHVYITTYIERCDRYGYGFLYLKHTPRELLTQCLRELDYRTMIKEDAFKLIDSTCKELEETGVVLGDFGNIQRQIVKNRALLVEKRLALSFLTAIIKAYDNG